MILPEQNEKIYHDIFWPILLIVLLGGCFIFTTHSLWRLTMDECYTEIEQAAGGAAATLKHALSLHNEHLNLVAGLMAADMSAGVEELEKKLDLYCAHQHVDALCVQLPDGTLIQGGSDVPDFASLPSFAAMRDAVPCISGRFPGVAGSEAWFLYQAVPIMQDGKLSAILYGLLNLRNLPRLFAASIPYNGSSRLYLLDGDTGDFLMDVWHDKFGNLFDGSMGSRVPKPGYDEKTFASDLASGRAGYFVFVSGEQAECFYTRYQPVGINNWSVHLTVPERVAFAKAMERRHIILALGGVVTLITALFLLAVFRQHRQRLHQKQLQIQQTSFMFEIQQILFDAHENPELMARALEQMSRTLGAEGALLLSLHDGKIHRVSAWWEETAKFVDATEGISLEKDFPHVYEQMLGSRSILFYLDKGEQNFSFSPEELELMRLRKVHSMMLTPVLDTEGVLHGALCVVNLRRQWKTCSYLECVARIFMMAMCNMESYQVIHDMGVIDILTGMKNRNSYETALPDYAAITHGIHCIYIDVNGLHELNNLKGHKAGDAMLRHTADCIGSLFGREHAYRIGGDEFVVFVMDESDEHVAAQLARLRSLMAERNYAISVGMSCRQGDENSLDPLLARAEAAMYEDKRAYYEKFDRRARRR